MGGRTMPLQCEVDELPPTQYLVLEVLAARHRLGESHWTFPASIRPALSALQAAGFVDWKDGVAQGTCRAWLTKEGRAAVLSRGYTPPNRVLVNLNYDTAPRPSLNQAAVQEAYGLGLRHGRQGR